MAGYWLIDVRSKDEAIEWVRRVPLHGRRRDRDRDPSGLEAEDFGDELTPALREQEERLRAQTGQG